MDRLRTLAVGGVFGVIVVTAMAAPVGATDTKGTLAIVNGVPGKRLDVCVNDTEIRSGLRYGGVIVRGVISTGEKVLKFYERDPRECKGRLHAKHDGIGLGPGDDYTIVATKNPKKVIVFDNSSPFLGEIPPAGDPVANAILAFRHGADFLASMKLRQSLPSFPIAPSAVPIWSKEDQYTPLEGDGVTLQVRATRPNDPDTVAFHRATVKGSHRYEWILVGSRPGNARFVFIDRIISNPSP